MIYLQIHITFFALNTPQVFVEIGGIAVERYGSTLEEEQEVLSILANMMINIFAMESAYLRAQKRIAKGLDQSDEQPAGIMTTIFIQETMERLDYDARQALLSMEKGDALQVQLSIIKKLMRAPLTNTIALKRQIAAKVIHSEQYIV